MVLCGAFSSLPGTCDNGDDSTTTTPQSKFLFSFTTGRKTGVTTPNNKCRKSAPPRSSSGKMASKIVNKSCLFDADTESMASSDPIVGSEVIISEARPTVSDRNNVTIRINAATSMKDSPVNGDGTNDGADGKLWHVALQHQQRMQQQKQQVNRHEKHLQHLQRMIHQNDTNANIRKRGLQEIGKFLPFSSSSSKPYNNIFSHNNLHNQNLDNNINYDHIQQQGISLQNKYNQHDKKQQQISKFCPICSCLLTYLYQSSKTRQLTEIHGGTDSPNTKAQNSIPPYCVGCRAYVVFDWLTEDRRKLLMGNLERRLDDALDAEMVGEASGDSNGKGKECVKSDRRGPYDSNEYLNAKIIVVGVSPSSVHLSEQESTMLFPVVTGKDPESQCLDPLPTNTSGEKNDFLLDYEMNNSLLSDISSLTNPKGPSSARLNIVTDQYPSQPYRRKGDVFFESPNRAHKNQQHRQEQKRAHCEYDTTDIYV